MSVEPIFRPQGRPMRVAVLFSGGASALKYLLARDPHLDERYSLVGALTDRVGASGIDAARRAGIPVEVLDYRAFVAARGTGRADPEARRAYFGEVVRRLAPWRPDVLMLSGFMLVVTEPLLGAYRHRILNVHPADLTVVDAEGRRKYTGMDAVAQAIAAGETHTRSTVHLVTEEVDGGPIVALSEPLKVEPGSSPQEHQERMKWACDGPAYRRALALVAGGRVRVDRETGAVEIAEREAGS